MVEVPFCGECGEELTDYFEVEAGLCIDCQMDGVVDLDQDPEDE